MSSVQAQKEKILKLNIKDKKLARLLAYSDLTPRDTLFLNYAYEQKSQLNFRYAIGISLILGLLYRMTIARTFSKTAANVSCGVVVLGGYMYWNSLIVKRFEKLTNTYFEKYGIL